MTNNDWNDSVEKTAKEVLSNIVERELKAVATRLVEEATKLVVEVSITKREVGESLDAAEKAQLNTLISAIRAPIYKAEVGRTASEEREFFGPRGEIYFIARAIMDIDEKLASGTSGWWILPVEVAESIGERIACHIRAFGTMPKQRMTYALIVAGEIKKWMGEDWNDETRKLVDRVVNPLFGVP